MSRESAPRSANFAPGCTVSSSTANCFAMTLCTASKVAGSACSHHPKKKTVKCRSMSPIISTWNRGRSLLNHHSICQKESVRSRKGRKDVRICSSNTAKENKAAAMLFPYSTRDLQGMRDCSSKTTICLFPDCRAHLQSIESCTTLLQNKYQS